MTLYVFLYSYQELFFVKSIILTFFFFNNQKVLIKNCKPLLIKKFYLLSLNWKFKEGLKWLSIYFYTLRYSSPKTFITVFFSIGLLSFLAMNSSNHKFVIVIKSSPNVKVLVLIKKFHSLNILEGPNQKL